MTLNNGGTINANQSNGLTIDTGGAVTNTGTIEDTGTGGLVIQNTTISGGTIKAQVANSFISLNNSSIAGATLSTANGGVIQTAGGNDSLDGSATTVNNAGSVLVNDDTSLNLLGTINNTGTITLNSAGNYTNLIVASPTVTLMGGGSVVLSNTSYTTLRIYGASASDVLDNVNNTISGAGQLGAGQLTLTNGGTINANQSSGLTIDTGGGIVTNTGTIEDTGAGGLIVQNTTISGGTIKAQVANSSINLNNSSIAGATLSTANGGVIQTVGGNDGLDGSATTVNNTGSVLVNDDTSLNLLGTINNTGTITLNSAGNYTNLIVASPTVTLTGGGSVVLSNTSYTALRIYGASASDVLDNVNNTISGAGQLGAGQLTLTNGGTINANQSSGLTIDTGGGIVTNTGTIEDTGAGGLIVQNTTISGGTIKAQVANSSINLNNSSIAGATLSSANGGVIQTVGGNDGLDGSATTVNNTGSVLVNDDTSLNLLGTINNTGTITLNSAGNYTNLIVASPTVTLMGGGSVVLSNTSYTTLRIYGAAASDVLDNVNNTISGAGQLGAGQLTLTNGGTINANQSNGLTINTGGVSTNTASGVLEGTGAGGLLLQNGTYTNNGLVEALDDSFVTYQSSAANTNDSGGTLTGGAWEASANGHGATLSITGGAVVTETATIILSGAGSVFQAGDGNNFTAIEQSLAAIGASGKLKILGGRNYTTTNALSNAGFIQLGGGIFTAMSLTDAAGSTLSGFGTVAAAFSDAGTVTATGGTLSFTGTGDSYSGAINGTGTVAFAGGADAINAGTNITVAAWKIGGGASVSVSEVLTYAGTFTKAGGTTVAIASGDKLTLTGSSTLAGTVSGAGTLAFGGGAAAINSGAKIATAALAVDGGAVVTLGESLTYSGALTEVAGSTLALGANVLTLTASSSTLAGAISGAGTVSFGGGGADALNSGASITTAGWTVTDAGTDATLNVAFTYGGNFTVQSGATVTLVAGKPLTLSGDAVFNGGTVAGAGALTTGGATTISTGGLTIGGTATWQNNGTVTAAGGLTLGNNTTLRVGLTNSATGAYDITGNAGIMLGGLNTSSFQNAGLLEKTGATGTSHIALNVASTNTVTVATGTLEFDGPSNRFAGAVGGAGTLAFGGGGSSTLASGLSLTVAGVEITGTATKVTLGTSFAYGGTFNQAAGTTVALGANNLSLDGTSTLAGTVSGAGALNLSGGTFTLGAGVAVKTAAWSIASGVNVVNNAAVTFAGGFTDAAATLTLGGKSLALTGAASFTASTVDGAGTLTTKGATAVAGLTLGGAAKWLSYGTVTESAALTIGDASGKTATVTNETGATYDITGDVGIAHISGGSGTFTNSGLLEKTAGAGTSAIGIAVTNKGTVTAASGTLDLSGAVTGAGALDIDGAATLQLDGAVAVTQTVSFSGGGDLALTNTSGFKASISGFAAGDTLDLTAFKFSGSPTAGFTENAGNTGGTLTITDGALHASITLLGQYMAAGFHTSQDSGSGADITYVPPPGGAATPLLLVPSHH